MVVASLLTQAELGPNDHFTITKCWISFYSIKYCSLYTVPIYSVPSIQYTEDYIDEIKKMNTSIYELIL